MKKSNNESRFPGYLMYPAIDDIMNRDRKVEGDIEDLIEGNVQAQNSSLNRIDEELELQRQDGDEILNDRKIPFDFSGSDLDVPGSELDDRLEAIGSEDEENNLYSLNDNNEYYDDQL